MTEKKKPGPDYKPLTPAQIVEAARLAGKGLPQNQIAAKIGVSRARYQRRLKDQPGVAEAIEKGVCEVNEEVVNITLDMIRTQKYPVLNIFWLKNRAKFEDITSNDDEDFEDAPTLRRVD